MYYEACRCGGVGKIKAKLMYAAVYHFGPRWDESGGTWFTATSLAEENERRWEELKERIVDQDLTLEEIESFSLDSPLDR